jgi:alpha-1,3-rhamnosyl/mannosyltransferase
VPVLAAQAGSLPEILGDGALLVDPLDVEALTDGLTRVLADDGLRASLVDRGHAHVQRYQWSVAAGEFAALYARLT